MGLLNAFPRRGRCRGVLKHPKTQKFRGKCNLSPASRDRRFVDGSKSQKHSTMKHTTKNQNRSRHGAPGKNGARQIAAAESRPPAIETINPNGAHPAFFSLPARGPDPVVGLARSTWLKLERDGLIRLLRIRRPGMSRGRVLVDAAAAIECVRKLAAESATK